MSQQPVSYSFLQYMFEYPLKQRQLDGRHFRALITYQFALICIGIFLSAALVDYLYGEYGLAQMSLCGVLLFIGVLYLHYRGQYLATASASIIIINLIIFIHDARYGFRAGIYFFYFPLFFSLFSTLSFRKRIWFGLHLGFTIACWAVMEITRHAWLLNESHSASSLRLVFLFSMAASLMVTILFVYLILGQIRNNAVIKEREKLKSVFDSNAQMIMLIGRDRKVELFNRKFYDYYQTIYGLTLQTGTDYLDYANPQNRPILAEGLDQAFAGHSVQQDVRVMMGDLPTWMSLNFVPVTTSGGMVNHVAFSVLDISERKNYEKSLSETNAILVKLNHELDHFIYRSSHDMRAPLASVMGLVELYQTEEDETERGQYIDMIGKSVHKLDHLLVDITKYAKNNKLELRRQRIDFQSVVHDLVEGIRYAHHAQSIDFQVNVNQDEVFVSDEERLRSVIGNLLSNAVRYRAYDRPAFVRFDVTISGAKARIVISDNGIGIEPEYVDRIFDMFFKVSNQSVGSGLGLYIVKETVATLGGTLSVQSVLDAGTCFTVELPGLSPPPVPAA